MTVENPAKNKECAKKRLYQKFTVMFRKISEKPKRKMLPLCKKKKKSVGGEICP